MEWKKSSVAAVLAITASVSGAHAADATYPTRPVRLIVPYPPGGSTDPTARAYGGWLTDKFGGTPNHLGMELLQAMTGVQFTHVPYKGGGPATVDLIAGRIQAIFGSIPQWQSHLASGKVRAIGIGHPKRVKSMPDVPAIAETLPGFNNTSWYGLLAPAGTPAPIIDKVNAEMTRAAANPEFIKHIESIGLEIASSTPKEMGDLIRTELARWTKVIKNAGIKPAE
jgi:tripartite-type tricarboxylate transporter receptor subunit TctC